MSTRALIVWGGWSGHQPEAVAELIKRTLELNEFEVGVSDSLSVFDDGESLRDLDLIVPVWTMGKITKEQCNALTEAVKGGVGIAGCHGGMCDAFREASEYQFMTGGQWVSHPGNDGVEYTVRITDHQHVITTGCTDFVVKSEQYYMHVDPSNHVLGTTRFPAPGTEGPHIPNGEVDMPVFWTRFYGSGKVFYSSLGHTAEVVAIPEHLKILERGLLWAANRL